MRRVPILFVSAALNVGGAERQWSLLIPQLRDCGFRPSVLTLLGRGRFFHELAEQGIPVHYAGARSRFDAVALIRATSQGSAHQIVVSQTLSGQAVAHAIGSRSGIPHVTTEHQPPGLERREHERLLLRVLAPRITVAVGVVRAQIPELISIGYRTEAIRIIPNGIPELAPKCAPLAVRRQLNLPDDAFVAVLVATLRPQKRAEVFIEAVVRASKSEPLIRGLVVGAGPEFPKIEERASRTAGIVKALGERTDVIDLLGMANVACLSSSTEGLPMVVLEAMALGKPVVMTDVRGIREAVEHEGTGLLVPADDVDQFAGALIRLARNGDFAHQLGRRAKLRHTRHFSADRMVGRYALLLESIAATTPLLRSAG